MIGFWPNSAVWRKGDPRCIQMRWCKGHQINSFGLESQSVEGSSTTTWIAVSKTVYLLRIGWTVIYKLPPKHDPKWTRSWDFLPTGSSWWRHFLWKCEGYRGLGCVKFLKLLAPIVTEKIKISHLRNTQTTVGPFEPHFWGQDAKMSIRLQKRKWSPWIDVSKTVNF